jgi:hypothetical protein
VADAGIHDAPQHQIDQHHQHRRDEKERLTRILQAGEIGGRVRQNSDTPPGIGTEVMPLAPPMIGIGG